MKILAATVLRDKATVPEFSLYKNLRKFWYYSRRDPKFKYTTSVRTPRAENASFREFFKEFCGFHNYEISVSFTANITEVDSDGNRTMIQPYELTLELSESLYTFLELKYSSGISFNELEFAYENQV